MLRATSVELHGAISLSLGPAVVIVVVFHRRLLLLPTAAAHAPRTQREAALKRQRSFSVRSFSAANADKSKREIFLFLSVASTCSKKQLLTQLS